MGRRSIIRLLAAAVIGLAASIGGWGGTRDQARRHHYLPLSLHVALSLTVAAVLLMSAGHAARAADAGVWQVQNPPTSGPPPRIFDLSCPTEAVCYAVGPIMHGPGFAGTSVWRTEDGGLSWSVRYTNETMNPGPLRCLTPEKCFLTAEQRDSGNTSHPVFMQTTDAGTTWSSHAVPSQGGAGAMACPAADSCYVLASSSVLVTTDAGATWTSSQPPPLGPGAIACPTAHTCYLPTETAVLKTTDGGHTWETQPMPPDLYISNQAIACPSVDMCVAGNGGAAVVTDDGGHSWTKHDTGLAYEFDAVACLSVSRCVAVGGYATSDGSEAAGVVATADGGRSWTLRTTMPHLEAGRVTVVCSGAHRCYLSVQGGSLLTSDDGGDTWHSPGLSASLNGIACSSPHSCVAVGEAGAVLTTSDAGRTWAAGASGTGDTLTAVACPAPRTCLAVGGIASSNPGIILGTANGGRTWSRRFSARAFLEGIACPTSMLCIAVGSGQEILRSKDGGQSWHASAVQPTAYTPIDLHATACPSGRVCFAVGGALGYCDYSALDSRSSFRDACESPEPGNVLRSRDGGRTWQVVYYHAEFFTTHDYPPGSYLSGIACPSEKVCYASGRGIALVTTNGGKTWRRLKGSPQELAGNSLSNAVACTGRTACYATVPSAIYQTSNGGRNWQPVWTGPILPNNRFATQGLQAITCLATGTCYAVGSGGLIVARVASQPASPLSASVPPTQQRITTYADENPGNYDSYTVVYTHTATISVTAYLSANSTVSAQTAGHSGQLLHNHDHLG